MVLETNIICVPLKFDKKISRANNIFLFKKNKTKKQRKSKEKVVVYNSFKILFNIKNPLKIRIIRFTTDINLGDLQGIQKFI